MKKYFTMMMVMALTAAANAGVVTYGWEDSGTALGTYGAILSTENSTDMAHAGLASLKISEQADSAGTPYAYVGGVTNLQEGDTVTVSFWVYDSGTSASGRIWGGYTTNDDLIDSIITGYEGSAGGSNTYSTDNSWSQLSYTWTIAAGKEALAIQARIYGTNDTIEDYIYIDDISITAPDTAMIHTPAVPEPATISLVAAGMLAFVRRRHT